MQVLLLDPDEVGLLEQEGVEHGLGLFAGLALAQADGHAGGRRNRLDSGLASSLTQLRGCFMLGHGPLPRSDGIRSASAGKIRSPSGAVQPACSALIARSLSTFFCNLPEAVRGRLSAMITCFGAL